MARNSKNAPATPATPATLHIVIRKDDKGESVVDANAILSVTPDEIKTSGSIMQQLCLNIMADKLDPAIRTAVGKKGGIARMFNGSISDPDVAALKVVTAATPEALQIGWKSFVGNAKRVRCISLQAMRKSLNTPSTDKTLTLKEAMAAWCATQDEAALQALDVGLYDILVQYILPKAEA